MAALEHVGTGVDSCGAQAELLCGVWGLSSLTRDLTDIPDIARQILFFKKIFYLFIYHWLEKAVAPHSSTLAWKIPWTEEPGRLHSMGLQRVGHD